MNRAVSQRLGSEILLPLLILLSAASCHSLTADRYQVVHVYHHDPGAFTQLRACTTWVIDVGTRWTNEDNRALMMASAILNTGKLGQCEPGWMKTQEICYLLTGAPSPANGLFNWLRLCSAACQQHGAVLSLGTFD